MDGQILIWIQEHLRAGWLNPIMRTITSLGNAGLFWILLALVLLSFKKTRKIGLACAVSIAIGALITNLILKNWIARIRPYEALESLSILVSKPHDFSFPSGHSTASFAGAWALFRNTKSRWRIPALVLAALIALSRLYVGVHYPTDVLAGCAIGILSGEISTRIVHRFIKIPKNN